MHDIIFLIPARAFEVILACPPSPPPPHTRYRGCIVWLFFFPSGCFFSNEVGIYDCWVEMPLFIPSLYNIHWPTINHSITSHHPTLTMSSAMIPYTTPSYSSTIGLFHISPIFLNILSHLDTLSDVYKCMRISPNTLELGIPILYRTTPHIFLEIIKLYMDADPVSHVVNVFELHC
jgi:hypothetical protein